MTPNRVIAMQGRTSSTGYSPRVGRFHCRSMALVWGERAVRQRGALGRYPLQQMFRIAPLPVSVPTPFSSFWRHPAACYTHARTHTHTGTQARARTHTHARAYTRTHTYIHTCVHTDKHTHTFTRVRPPPLTHPPTHTHRKRKKHEQMLTNF